MPREMCYRCFWPKAHCWCASIRPMATRTRFVFLMHPKEFKQEKAATGRLTHLCLSNSEILVGTSFDEHAEVQALLRDPRRCVVLLYPGPDAFDLADRTWTRETLHGRELVILILDATWACARKMLRLSPSLQRLPRVKFNTTTPSRYLIKQQPQPGCLSTLEAAHESLLALARSGADAYPDPGQLLDLFQRMQDFQIRCAEDPTRSGYRRKPYSSPAQRTVLRGESAKRNRYIK